MKCKQDKTWRLKVIKRRWRVYVRRKASELEGDDEDGDDIDMMFD